MISVSCGNPTQLWLWLGATVLDPKKRKYIIDLDTGSRLISIANYFEINHWDPEEWTGTGIFHTVGYERTMSSKMTRLTNTYLDPQQWAELKKVFSELRTKAYFFLGMNFKTKVRGKGGCLSSFHIVKTPKTGVVVTVTSKIAEVPKKFLADLKLINWMLQSLELKPMCVVFNITTVFFSLVTMRSYKTIWGMDLKTDLNLDKDFGGYQKPTVRRIANYRDYLRSQYGKLKVDRGMSRYLNPETGDWYVNKNR